MRYAENWTKVNIEHLNLEKVITWCNENLKGQQFIENSTIKFENEEEATMFKLSYKE